MATTQNETRPLIIEIIHDTHVYTATVWNWKSLDNHLGQVRQRGGRFRFGSIEDYGTFCSIEALCQQLNSYRHWASYDSRLSRFSENNF